MQGGNRQIRTVGELRPLLPEEKYLQRQKTITDSKNTEETPQTRRKEEINLLLIIFLGMVANLSFFLLFCLFLLPEGILLKHLPKLTEFRFVLVETTIAKTYVFVSSLSPLVVVSQLWLQHSVSYFKVTQSLFVSVLHEETTTQIVEDSGSVHRLHPQQLLSNISCL